MVNDDDDDDDDNWHISNPMRSNGTRPIGFYKH